MLRAGRFRAPKSNCQCLSTRRPISRQPVRARPFLQVLEDRTLPTADLTLFSPEAITGDRFGGAVVVREDEIVAGAPRADVNGVSKAGAVYIFDSVSGDLLRTIENPNPTKGDKFGKSVALLDDFIIIGAPGARHNGQVGAGVVYIFDGDSGELRQTLRQPGRPSQLGFGSSIVVQDELIIIGAPQDDGGGMVTRGAVYVFDGDTGQLLRTINSPTADLGVRDRFGRSIAAFETQIVVGAPRSTINGVVHTGAVHVFDLNTGQLVRTIANPEPGAGDRFGRAVAMLDDVILVGTPRGGANGAEEIGVVHFFDADTGQLLNTLANPGAGKADRFGRVVMVEDGMIFVSAPLTDHEGEINAGLAYQFDADHTLTKTWVSPTPISGELYGLSMAVFGSTTVVGAKSRSTAPLDSGMLYVYLDVGVIAGFKFNDLNGNGVRDEGEPGLAGFTFFLDANNNGIQDAGELTAVSGADGVFRFENVKAGTYRVREIAQAGWTQTTANPGPVTLGGGQSISGGTFGNFRQITISGVKFDDRNGNGVRDFTENGLEGWTIFIDSDDNGELDEGEVFTTTGADGSYAFTNLGPGQFLIREVSQDGWLRTTANPEIISAMSGADVADVNFGNFQTISISGQKFHDLNGNAEKDEGEPGLEGWTIFIDANDNGQLDEGELFAVTDADGNYTITGVGPGLHRAREVGQAGWAQSSPVPADLTALSGTNITDIDFGNFQFATISGLKYEDLNGNGARDEGEPGLAGWMIFLDDNLNGILDETEPFAITAEDGTYTIAGVGNGPHFVRELHQEGWVQSSANPGMIFPMSGQIIIGIDFGNFRTVSISGVKFDDRNTNGERDDDEPGLEGWTIYIDANDNGQLDEGELFAVTSADGRYVITGAGPGPLRVREVAERGWQQTTPIPADIFPTSGVNVAGIDFGNFQLARIGGVKFNDLNGNGVRDEGESGLAGWTIFVDLNDNGELDDDEPLAVTSEDGSYLIVGLEPGTYLVREAAQAGWIQTTADPDPVTLSDGELVEGIAFGNFKDIAISGRKFNDLNGNGELDDGEEGLEGWTIFLDANDNGELDDDELFAVTDAEGNYTFTGVGPGMHRVREVLQEGWEATTPLPNPIEAVSGQDVLDILFGNREAV